MFSEPDCPEHELGSSGPGRSTCTPCTTRAMEDLFGLAPPQPAHDLAGWAANFQPEVLKRVNTLAPGLGREPTFPRHLLDAVNVPGTNGDVAAGEGRT
ncbi:MAG: hypothetical protein WBP72_15460 [Rhodocyclaceae bacterium]